MLKPNNILSYFIKDIKDPKEYALYKQFNNIATIELFYKDKMIYYIRHYKLKPEISYNYKNNIIKEYFTGRIINYKIDYCKSLKHKALLYKKAKIRLKTHNDNYIYYTFIYNKYLYKNNFHYIIDNKSVLYIRIKYYNRYIYKYISLSAYKYKSNHKYNYILLLIMNKYELHYINRFFNLFFVRRKY